MIGYIIVDRDGKPLHEEPFATERKAYEAKRVYEDHCYEPRPYKVVKADDALLAQQEQVSNDDLR